MAKSTARALRKLQHLGISKSDKPLDCLLLSLVVSRLRGYEVHPNKRSIYNRDICMMPMHMATVVSCCHGDIRRYRVIDLDVAPAAFVRFQ